MEQAETDYKEIVSDAKKKASEIIDQAKHQHSSIVEEARENAKKEADKVTLASNQQIQQEIKKGCCKAVFAMCRKNNK